ncbi:hypothetical protein [Aquicoccus sp.]|uniref:hypothetical protein n=1 Tax=Aquicoccus sp. TaxID=2055851 RepID=UPI0035644078
MIDIRQLEISLCSAHPIEAVVFITIAHDRRERGGFQASNNFIKIRVPPIRRVGSNAQGTACAKLRTLGLIHDVTGPEPPLVGRSNAAPQPSLCGHSCITQHFFGWKTVVRDISELRCA